MRVLWNIIAFGLLKSLSGIKHLYSCDCEVGSQICDFKSLLQIEWFRCCSPGRAATSATWRFWLFQYILNYYFFHMYSSHFLDDINSFCRCFEQNNCGGLFLTHEEGTSRSSLGACGYFSDVSWKLIIFIFTFCKSLPFFYFLTSEKGRLLYIHPVGRSVGWLVDVTINFFQYIEA